MKLLKKINIISFTEENLEIENNLNLEIENFILFFELNEKKEKIKEILGFVYEINLEKVKIKINKSLRNKENIIGTKIREKFYFPFNEFSMGNIYNFWGEKYEIKEIYSSKKLIKINYGNYEIFNPISREIPKIPFFTGIGLIDLFTTIIKGQKISFFISEEYEITELLKIIINNKKEKIFLNLVGIDEKKLIEFQEIIKKNYLKNIFLIYSLNSDDYFERKYIFSLFNNICNSYIDKNPCDIISIIYDFSEFGEYLKEESIFLGELPGRKGYPFNLYSKFAEILENCGNFKKGSITQINMLKIPKGDVGNIFADLIGYISEGQIVIDQENILKKFEIPINIFQSISRLMSGAINEKNSFKDHKELSFFLKKIYFESIEIYNLSKIIGLENLTEIQKKKIKLKKDFEKFFFKNLRFLSLSEIRNKCLSSLKNLDEKELNLNINLKKEILFLKKNDFENLSN